MRKKIIPFFQMLRLPNLLIIILTQVLLRYLILIPIVYGSDLASVSALPDFLILVIITVLMAAGGYVINDYFDVKIDSINRPEKQVVDRVISARGAILLHMILNIVAILLGFYLAWRIHALSFGLIFPFLSAVLWIYSAKYKKVIFWGNFIVSTLSAFVILIVWLYEFFWLRLNPTAFTSALPVMRYANWAFAGYALFAFLVSFIREIIKDIEDEEGDRTFGCKTLPVVLGLTKTRYITCALVLCTILLMTYVQVMLFRFNLILVFWYFMVTVQAGALYLLILLFQAKSKEQFHFISTLCKVIMLAGILSMEIIYISI